MSPGEKRGYERNDGYVRDRNACADNVVARDAWARESSINQSLEQSVTPQADQFDLASTLEGHQLLPMPLPGSKVELGEPQWSPEDMMAMLTAAAKHLGICIDKEMRCTRIHTQTKSSPNICASWLTCIGRPRKLVHQQVPLAVDSACTSCLHACRAHWASSKSDAVAYWQ